MLDATESTIEYLKDGQCVKYSSISLETPADADMLHLFAFCTLYDEGVSACLEKAGVE